MRASPIRLASVLLCGCLVLPGCLYSRAKTDTPRTATEQLLLTRSVWRATGKLELPDVDGRNVALEIHSLAGDDVRYLEAVLSDRLRERGARIVKADGDAPEIVLVILAEALGTVSRGLEFGIPPIPLSGYTTPGLPLIRILKQRGYTAMRSVVRDGDGHVLGRTEPVMERASFELYSVLFLAVYRNDIYPGEELELGVD